MAEARATAEGTRFGRKPKLTRHQARDGLKRVAMGEPMWKRQPLSLSETPIRLASDGESGDAHARWSTFSYCCGLH
jgi:hypothetical protein